MLYTDDANVFFSSKDLTVIVRHANIYLQNLLQWLSANQLLFNTQKTKYIIFSAINKPVQHQNAILFES